MDEIRIRVGDILKNNKSNVRERVICIRNGQAVLCRMDCNKLVLGTHDLTVINCLLDEMDISVVPCDCCVFDTSELSPEVKMRYENYLQIIQKIKAVYGPDYLQLSGKGTKMEFENILAESGLARPTLWKIVRMYLQSGFDTSCLVDKRAESKSKCVQYGNKPGRKSSLGLGFGILVSEKEKQQFQKALDYYKSGREKTYEDAYDFLCMKYYSQTENTSDGLVKTLLPASQRPTFRQFYYFCDTHITKEEKDLIKTSRQEQRNNKRLLLSDNLNGVMGPWDCFEMDEVEVDLSLVSTYDQTKVVGRPIVYVMVDVYTRLIAAVSISFDNNSVLAFTNCLKNLIEDKKELCKKYGLSIPDDVWPSGYLPRRIRCDRGAEYRSKRVKNICNELGITVELVTAGTGSLKGSVEQIFHMMHTAQNPDLENKGLIEKRHDSMHHQEARLNIDDFSKVFMHFVVTYNQRYMKEYPLTKDMVEQKARPVPLELWKYGTHTYGMPMPITNREQFFYSLLTPVTAKVSRLGITYKGLYYINYEDKSLLREMYACGNKKKSFEVRMDECDISYVYYIREGRLVRAALNESRTGNADYAGLTYREYEALRHEKRVMDVEGEEQNRQLRVARKELNRQTIDCATNRSKTLSIESVETEDIRKNRRIEQQEIANRKKIAMESEDSSIPQTAETTDEFDTTIDNWDDAMALFD